MVETLFEEWQVYEKLLIHDYMDHRAFFSRLQEEILSRFSHPIALLDLGCGDLTPVLPLLENAPIKRYVGIDESTVALDIASGRLDDFQLSRQLIAGDLTQRLPAIHENFDVILASFSLHHLADPADKLRTLEAVQQHLNPGGLFALVDVFSAESESREQYLPRWIGDVNDRYEALLPEEKQLLFDHGVTCDYPLSECAYQALAVQAGLPEVEVLRKDSTGLYGLVVFSRGD